MAQGASCRAWASGTAPQSRGSICRARTAQAPRCMAPMQVGEAGRDGARRGVPCGTSCMLPCKQYLEESHMGRAGSARDPTGGSRVVLGSDSAPHSSPVPMLPLPQAPSMALAAPHPHSAGGGRAQCAPPSAAVPLCAVAGGGPRAAWLQGVSAAPCGPPPSPTPWAPWGSSC